jgi:hypothetical protein
MIKRLGEGKRKEVYYMYRHTMRRGKVSTSAPLQSTG